MRSKQPHSGIKGQTAVLASSWNRALAEETGKAIGNKVREYASESSRLLRDILRDEWGFRGFMMTERWMSE